VPGPSICSPTCSIGSSSIREMAGQLTEDQLAGIRIFVINEALSRVDKDREGIISMNQLCLVCNQLLPHLRRRPTLKELEDMMNEVDATGTGCINFTELLDLIARKMQDM